jgi:hypothetical protein
MKKTSILILFFFLGCVKTEIEPSEKLPINFIGDSMTQGAGSEEGFTYPFFVSKLLPNRTINNSGIGGQTAQQIAGRQGGLPIYITLSGNAFSGTDPIFLDSLVSNVSGTRIPNLFLSTPATNYSYSIDGEVNNIPCTISRKGIEGPPSIREIYTITPKSANNSAIPPNSLFIPNDGLKQKQCISVIWLGRNNYGYAKDSSIAYVNEIIKKTVEFNSAKKFLVLGILPNLSDTIGSVSYKAINKTNLNSYTAYPNNYIEMTPPDNSEMSFISYVPSSQDKIDISKGTFPSGMKADNTHLNSIGYHIIANRVYKKLKELNY